jgi:ribonuclease E
MPYGRGVSLSRRIKNDNERNRLRALAILLKPAGMGLLVRTEAEGTVEEAIIEDLELLQKQWEKTQQDANSINPPALLNRDDDFIQRVLRDMYADEVNRIVVDSEESVKRVKKQLMNWGGGKHPQGVVIDYHQESRPILDYFRVNAAIKEALKPRVELPSGGYIIIEPTEALTVIDVNSGSFTHSATSRETVLWTNYEAAAEIARQLKLRNIGGVIIVDFIDMDSRRDKLKLLEHFNRALKTDKARPQIAQLSELGLVELTRKRQGKNIYELFGLPCSHCAGLGLLAHLPGHHNEVEPLPASYYQPIIVTKNPEKIAADDKTNFLEDYTNEQEDLELINHPSYQEQTGSTRRRRRRRETGGKEEPILVSATNGSVTEAETKPERKERTMLPRTPRRDESKMEKVVIKMTEAEQDIYALMGVSPILHLGQELKDKDPKSILIYVSSPDDESNILEDSDHKHNSSVDISENPVLDGMVNTVSSPENNDCEDTLEPELGESEQEEIDKSNYDADIEIDDTQEGVSNNIIEPETISEAIIKDALEQDRPVVRTRRRRTSTSSVS